MQVRSAELFCQWIPVKDGNEEQIQKESCYTAITKKPTPSLFLYICINRCAKEAHSDPTLNTFIMWMLPWCSYREEAPPQRLSVSK